MRQLQTNCPSVIQENAHNVFVKEMTNDNSNFRTAVLGAGIKMVITS